MRQLTWLDHRYLSAETPRTPQHVCTVSIYDQHAADGTRISFDDVRRRIDECLPFVPVLREKLVDVPFGLDEPYWVRDPDFDLEYHVREASLPAPGGWTQLCTQVGALHSRPLDRARPLWELTFVGGLTDVDWLPGEAFALVLKVHFAAVDPVAGVKLITALHDVAPDSPRPVAKEDWAADRVPGTPSLLRRAAVHALTRPADAARLLARNLEPVLREIPRGRGRPIDADGRAPRTRFNYPINPHKVYDATSLPLDGLRAARKAVPGATVTDVALTVIGGALRRYLEAKDDLPAPALTAAVPIARATPTEPAVSVTVEPRTQIITETLVGISTEPFAATTAETTVTTAAEPFVVTSARPPLGRAARTPAVALAGVGEPPPVTVLVTSMHTDIADPLARLAAVHATSSATAATAHGSGAAALRDVSQLAPGAVLGVGARVAAAFVNDGEVFVNSLVTNTPGPGAPLFLLGAQLRMLGDCTPLADNTGLGHSLVSYVDRLGVHVTSCREMLPDPQFYLECVRHSFDEVMAATTPGARG